jgi:C-terminal processing protease CtpA/Prc
LPKLNWTKLKNTCGKKLERADTVFGVAAVIADMLTHLENLHVWVKAGDDWLPGFSRPRPLNANWKATEKIVGPLTKAGNNFHWSRKGDLGYLNIHGLMDQDLPGQVDQALESLKDTKGLIVDLRFNGGGDELLARKVAGRFVDKERIYSLNQYRSGPKHSQLGEKLERAFGPRGAWQYQKPVVVLWGRKTFSSAESMALMFAQCPQVTTMGDYTGGSSANPRRIELSCGITVNLPRWLDMDPKGNPIEHVGVKPKKLIKAKPEDFTAEQDPVLEAAIKQL